MTLLDKLFAATELVDEHRTRYKAVRSHHGESSVQAAVASRQLDTLIRHRRELAVRAIRAGVDVAEVRLKAGVPWWVLNAWCQDEPLSVEQAYGLFVGVETARASNETRKAKAADPHRLRTASWRETVSESDREYEAFFGEKARRFGFESSFKDADEAQALINHEHLIVPDLITLEQFRQIYEDDKMESAGPQAPDSDSAAEMTSAVPTHHDALDLDLDDLGLPEFNDDELDECF